MEQVIEKGSELIKQSLVSLENKDYATSKQQILEAQEMFKSNKSGKYISV